MTRTDTTAIRRNRLLAGMLGALLLLALLPARAVAGPPGPPDPPPAQTTTEFCANVPASYEPFTDVTGNKANIECLAFAGITTGGPRGLPETSYGPGIQVERDEMATFIARTIAAKNALEAPGATLFDLPPYDGTNNFSDVPATIQTAEGPRPNPHLESINRLAQAGVVTGGPGGRPATVYAPDEVVRRDQMATFIFRAEDFLTDGAVDGDGFPPGLDYFTDDDGIRPHEPNINAIAQAGVVNGRTGDLYAPSEGATRDQMASFLVRLLAENLDRDLITALPAPGPGVAATLTLTPDSDTNPVGTNHTVSAAVRDSAGDPILGGPVRFEVYIDTDSNGTFSPASTSTTNRQVTFVTQQETITGGSNPGGAEPSGTGPSDANAPGQARFTFQGNAGGTFLVVACADPDGDDRCATVSSGTVVKDPEEVAYDDARKLYVALRAASPTTNATESGVVVDVRPAGVAGQIDVYTPDAEFLTYTFDTNDSYTVDGTATTVLCFQQAASENDAVTVAGYTSAGPSPTVTTFGVTDRDNSGANCEAG